jgi:hypothetical protein
VNEIKTNPRNWIEAAGWEEEEEQEEQIEERRRPSEASEAGGGKQSVFPPFSFFIAVSERYYEDATVPETFFAFLPAFSLSLCAAFSFFFCVSFDNILTSFETWDESCNYSGLGRRDGRQSAD